MRKNSANILRESPDPYRLSPASLLNQQNRAQIYQRPQSVMSELNISDDNTTSSARSSPIQIEVSFSSTVKPYKNSHFETLALILSKLKVPNVFFLMILTFTYLYLKNFSFF